MASRPTQLTPLSAGKRSPGEANGRPETLFDEPYAGLDPVARQLFYDRLLADYAAHPRTVLLSTHLIDEAAGLLERVVVIDRGKVVFDADADDLRGAATSVSGPAIAVAEFTVGRPVWNRRRIAGQESAVVAGPLDDTDRARAATLRLSLEPLTGASWHSSSRCGCSSSPAQEEEEEAPCRSQLSRSSPSTCSSS